MLPIFNPISLLILGVGFALAITIHEAAHAFMANRLGDPTPRLQKRLTLNPLAHLDPWGTLVLFITGFRFGWGRPVQFDPYNLENPRRDAALISIAGPLSNLFLASLFSIIFRIYPSSILEFFIFINVALAVFNLIPIHPLDGGKILVGLLSPQDAINVNRFLNQYGTILLLILILPLGGGPLISIITTPLINFFLGIFIPASFTF